MIVPDINLLVYAYRDEAPEHGVAKEWWERLLNGSERVGLSWVVISGFVRIITHRNVSHNSLAPSLAIDAVNEWFDFPHVVTVHPGANHLSLFRANLEAAGVGGNLVTDAHIAALAMEYQAEVHTNDSDFARFPGLRWRNPL